MMGFSLGQAVVMMAGLRLQGPVLIVAGRSAQRLLAATWEQSFQETETVHVVHTFGGECSLVS